MSNQTWTQEQIKEILPHRAPMLLVDSASIDEEGYACGIYHVRGDEHFLSGHFPGNPVVPGVIQCEILAQTCCVLMGNDETIKRPFTPYFTGLNKVKFKGMVKPGDTLNTRVTITKSRHPFYWAAGSATVDGKVVVTAELSFAVITDEEGV